MNLLFELVNGRWSHVRYFVTHFFSWLPILTLFKNEIFIYNLLHWFFYRKSSMIWSRRVVFAKEDSIYAAHCGSYNVVSRFRWTPSYVLNCASQSTFYLCREQIYKFYTMQCLLAGANKVSCMQTYSRRTNLMSYNVGKKHWNEKVLLTSTCDENETLYDPHDNSCSLPIL